MYYLVDLTEWKIVETFTKHHSFFSSFDSHKFTILDDEVDSQKDDIQRLKEKGYPKTPTDTFDSLVITEKVSNVTIPDLYNGLIDTYNRKNADYGNSFDISLDKYGLISALTRMSDKFNRAETLIMNGGKAQVQDEKLEDTLLDLANYCVMTVAYIKNNK